MDKKRALSWSSISSFEYNKEQWFDSYILGKRQSSPEMTFGKMVGDKLAKDPTYLPQVPRLNTFEHKFEVMFNKIPLIGYADSFCTITNKKMKEYKTGVKPWTKKRADEHAQIDMYLLMHYITKKIKPEDVDCELIWLPTKKEETGDFKVTISFVEPLIIQTFKTKRTMNDILIFGQRIKDRYKEMQEYVKSRQ